MDGLASRASMIRLSLHPLPASETSAFNKIRAFSTQRAGLFPFRIRVSSCSRSSPLSLTTYFFTEISFAAMRGRLVSPGAFESKIIKTSVADEVLRRHSPFGGFHSSESVQHPAFYRYQESYPRRNGSPRNCCSRAGDERNAVAVSV